MRKRTLKSIIVSLAVALCLVMSCVTAFAAGTEMMTLPVTVKYGQTEARAMLDMINDFRTGSDAWYWNSSDTEKVTVKASELIYDYGLEQIAMQRAAEIALSFAHTRPNGDSCFTASVGSYSSYGENIAAGYATASAVFEGWQETDLKYSGQGHRRNMLNEGYTHVGIGHVYVNGYHYWVQEFGYGPSGTAKTSANDSNATVNIEINTDMITSLTVETAKTLSMSVGGSSKVPTADVKIKMQDTWPGTPVATTITPSWTVSGSAVSISNGNIVAKSAGRSTLTATVYGKTVTVTVEVECTSHKWGSWTAKKAATCIDAGSETRQCSVCGKEESRTVAASGHKMGSYKVVKAATEKADGLEERTCSVCGKIEQRVIAKLSPETSGENTASTTKASNEEATTSTTKPSNEEDTTSTTKPSDEEATTSPDETAPSEATTGADADGMDESVSQEETDHTEAAPSVDEDLSGAPEQAEDDGQHDTDTAPGEKDNDGENNTQLYVVIVSVAALMIAGGAGIYFVIRARKKG